MLFFAETNGMNIESRDKNDISNKVDEKDAIGKVTGFFLFRGIIASYNEDKQKDEESRKNIKKYGKIAITLGLIALFMSASCLISSLSRLDLVGMSYVVMLVIYVLSGIVVALILALYGFVFSVMQVRLNRKSIGIFGIILSLFDIFLAIGLVVILVV